MNLKGYRPEVMQGFHFSARFFISFNTLPVGVFVQVLSEVETRPYSGVWRRVAMPGRQESSYSRLSALSMKILVFQASLHGATRRNMAAFQLLTVPEQKRLLAKC